jgi:hypothetical protein
MKALLQGMGRTAVAEGWMDAPAVDAIAADLDAWAERPDSFAAQLYCEAVGWARG